MIPHYKLIIYDYGLIEKHTITDEAIEILAHAGVNDDLGNFNIKLPANLGFPTNPTYSDIVPGDRIKLWLGWETGYDSGDPDFYGRVSNVSSVSGLSRVITGKSVSEILGRRIKARKVWTATQADDIIAEIASDLSLGAGEIAVDTTVVNIEQDSETYLDIMRKVSDYWYSAGTQIKKDFYVDFSSNLNLVWKARPIRTTGVETLTWGENILGYTLLTEGVGIKNAIGIYGALTPFNPKDSEVYGRKDPTDGDGYTYGSGWTMVSGSVASANSSPSPQIGTDYAKYTVDPSTHALEFYRSLNHTVSYKGIGGYSVLEFWSMRNNLGNTTLRLMCPDSSNYFYLGFVTGDVNDTWKFHRYSLGPTNEYDAATNPDGEWTPSGSPDWEQMAGLYFVNTTGTASGQYMGLDGLCLNFGRWRYVPASDATSITNYDENDNIIIDDNLKSDGECESRAKTILYEHKDPVKRLDITTYGNTNILRGDRLSMTIPPENISAVNYYVVSTEQHLVYPDGWQTTTTLLDTVNCREIPSVREQETLARSIKNLQQISRNQRRVN